MEGNHAERVTYSLDLIHLGGDEELTILSSPLPQGVEEGELAVECGVVDVPGQYAFKVVDDSEGEELARSSVIEAVLPMIEINLPKEFRAFSANVSLRVASSQIVCDSTPNTLRNSNSSVVAGSSPDVDSFEFRVFRQNSFLPPSGHIVLIPDDARPSLIHSFPLTSLLSLSADVIDYKLPCNLFDRAGHYFVALWRCDRNHGCANNSSTSPASLAASATSGNGSSYLQSVMERELLMGESNFMSVQFGDTYRVKADRYFVFPCSKYVTIR